jgi:hypothetical protein
MKKLRAMGAALDRVDARFSVIRAGEWWEFKLVPILTLFYGTALYLQAPLLSLWPAVVSLLAALAPGAVFVSAINDVTDRIEDARAGKTNRLAGKSGVLVAALIGCPVAVGLVFVFLWRDDPPLVLAYLGAWAAFSLYSLPPFRLKTRGWPGLLADASGAHLFPTLVAVLLAYRATGHALDPVWIGAAAMWALAYGVRGILWHQLADADNDRTAGVATFVQRTTPGLAAALGRWGAFPLELGALAVLTYRMGPAAPAAALTLYLGLVGLRVWLWRMKPVIVQSPPGYLIVLQDYYSLILPIGLLIASALRHPWDWAALAIHLMVFPRGLFVLGRDLVRMHRFVTSGGLQSR